MQSIYEEIVKSLREGKKVAIATVISVKGSAPREEGAKMLIRSDGTILGSVGGGPLEAIVLKEAIQVIAEGKAKTVHFDLTGARPEEGICGGVADVFIEPIATPPTMYVFGGGHIGLPLARMGKMCGFRIVVIDDRPEFANPERFPEADEIYVRDYANGFPELMVDGASYIAIITRCHETDEVVLDWAVTTEANYIGMIGSRKKKKTVFSHLQSRGVPQKVLDKVHTPIGVDIRAETPEEIAVSILGQIIQVKRETEGTQQRAHDLGDNPGSGRVETHGPGQATSALGASDGPEAGDRHLQQC